MNSLRIAVTSINDKDYDLSLVPEVTPLKTAALGFFCIFWHSI